jgi:hypothetical protein
MKTSEREHIEAVGDRWPAILAATNLSVRQNAKLVGLDKIRQPLAIQAALKATGFGNQIFQLPYSAGKLYADMQTITDAAFAAAVEAGERAFASTPVDA